MSVCTRCGLTRPAPELPLCPRCLLQGEELEQPQAPPGLVLEQEIGRGGMGRIFRARQVRLERDVAVKFLPPEGEREAGSGARFEREARTLGSLSHPHIVSVFDFGVLPSDERYLVMELMPGGTLRERLPLPEAEALRIATELCSALAYAHERGVVHRDIKPDNVLFDAQGRAKLADFGIARALQATAADALTHPLHVLGTPGFLAPEALAGAAPAPRMDVFALGVLLRVMVQGRMAAPERGALSPELSELLAQATAAEPERRPADGAALLQELQRLTAPRASGQGTGGAARGEANEAAELPPDEQSWLRAVALTLTGATALSLHALLVSVTPRAMEANALTAFVIFGGQALPDGRVLTRARFETMPTLAAAGGWAMAFFAYGLLRRHWRTERLEVRLPDRALAGSRHVLGIGAVLFVLYVLRVALIEAGVAVPFAYLPLLGGVMELIMLHLFWSTVLDALRRARPLRREPLLWLGLGLALVPPVVTLLEILAAVP